MTRLPLEATGIVGRLYRFSLRVGVDLLRAGQPRWAARRLVNPLSYYRGCEFRMLFDLAAFAPGQRILDIGSPKLVFLYLATQPNLTVCGTDLFGDFIPPATAYFRQRGLDRDLGSRIVVEQQDARALPYPDESFDRVYSVSVVEHIPGNGDAVALAEMARVLKPGGRVVLTVPYRAGSGSTVWRDRSVYGRDAADGPVFYERHYGPAELRALAHAVPVLRPRRVQYIGERWLPWGDLQGRLPAILRLPLAPAQPLAEGVFLQRVRSSAPMSRGAAILFEKESSH